MRPGFIRVVEPAYDYFAGYDAKHNPEYRWTAVHVQQLRQILGYAKSRGITVMLGDWSNPMINGDARIPADFLAQLHDVYGYTNIKYYNLINEPNYQAGCDFGCWTGMVTALSSEFTSLGLSSWLELVGPDNANSWDDTSAAQALDRTVGLDTDNPLGGDSWVTDTLHAIPGLIGAYDSHRYATIWGIENGVWEDQLRARREQINNLDSPTKPYFAGELGLTARQVTPFSARAARSSMQSLAALVDPSSAPSVSSFVDSQPHIREFVYGVWMGDMMVQGIAAGLSGASAWDLDDAMHVGGQYGSQNLKQWGFWNSLGGQDGYPASDRRLRPWYYPWSVLARSFPAGSRPLLVPSTGVPGLRVAAAKIPNAGKYDLSFAVVNDSDAARAIRLAVPSATAPVTLARYDYFAADRPTDGSGFPVPKRVLQQVDLSQGVTLHLPTRGVVVLSSVGYDAPIALSDSASRLVDDLDGLASGLSPQRSPEARSRRPRRVQLRPLARDRDEEGQARPVPDLPRESDHELRAQGLLPKATRDPCIRLSRRHDMDADQPRIDEACADGRRGILVVRGAASCRRARCRNQRADDQANQPPHRTGTGRDRVWIRLRRSDARRGLRPRGWQRAAIPTRRWASAAMSRASPRTAHPRLLRRAVRGPAASPPSARRRRP